MKIQIIQNNNPIRVYHHPRDVVYDEENMTITIGSKDPTTYNLLKAPILLFSKVNNSSKSEIFVEFVIRSGPIK